MLATICGASQVPRIESSILFVEFTSDDCRWYRYYVGYLSIRAHLDYSHAFAFRILNLNLLFHITTGHSICFAWKWKGRQVEIIFASSNLTVFTATRTLVPFSVRSTGWCVLFTI
eukprot:PhF_6_TR13235/c3_g1_i9/m.20961